MRLSWLKSIQFIVSDHMFGQMTVDCNSPLHMLFKQLALSLALRKQYMDIFRVVK